MRYERPNVSLTISVIHGPLDGCQRPFTGLSQFVYESAYGVRHEYARSTDDGEQVWRYMGATQHAEAA